MDLYHKEINRLNIIKTQFSRISQIQYIYLRVKLKEKDVLIVLIKINKVIICKVL